MSVLQIAKIASNHKPGITILDAPVHAPNLRYVSQLSISTERRADVSAYLNVVSGSTRNAT